jgi:hypothetical protein
VSAILRPPNGYPELLKIGDPRHYIGPDGRIDSLQWELHLNLVHVPFPGPLGLSYGHPDQLAHAVSCHPIAAEPFRHVFAILAAEGLWHELRTFGGGYVFRTKRTNASELSVHSWGLAADFNVQTNKQGTPGDMSPAVVQVFEAAGFVWGGRFHTSDPMHFQYARGY